VGLLGSMGTAPDSLVWQGKQVLARAEHGRAFCFDPCRGSAYSFRRDLRSGLVLQDAYYGSDWNRREGRSALSAGVPRET